jgi:hypothetical protein
MRRADRVAGAQNVAASGSRSIQSWYARCGTTTIPEAASATAPSFSAGVQRKIRRAAPTNRSSQEVRPRCWKRFSSPSARRGSPRDSQDSRMALKRLCPDRCRRSAARQLSYLCRGLTPAANTNIAAARLRRSQFRLFGSSRHLLTGCETVSSRPSLPRVPE